MQVVIWLNDLNSIHLVLAKSSKRPERKEVETGVRCNLMSASNHGSAIRGPQRRVESAIACTKSCRQAASCHREPGLHSCRDTLELFVEKRERPRPLVPPECIGRAIPITLPSCSIFRTNPRFLSVRTIQPLYSGENGLFIPIDGIAASKPVENEMKLFARRRVVRVK
jgi:hypothetical protein